MARHNRLQSSTRLDIVATCIMLDGEKPITATKTGIRENGSSGDSPLSLDGQHQQRFKERAAMVGGTVLRSNRRESIAASPQSSSLASFVRQALMPSTSLAMKSQKEPQPAFQQGERWQQQQQASAPPAVNGACSPRSPPRPRPTSLTLRNTNGHTALKSPELKQRICDARADEAATVTQVPLDKREALPPTPTTPFTMGNKTSIISGSQIPDDKSLRSVVRRESRRPVSRKSSSNLFKRVDSKSPLPRDLPASVMSMLHRDGHEKSDSCATDDDGLVSVPTDPFFDQPEQYDGRYPEMSPKVHSASTITMTEEKAGMPLSASTTIRDYRSTEQSPVQSTEGVRACDIKDLPPLPPSVNDALSPASPTLPAPSPLPEDSPHKYGLRDKIDTPEVPEQPEKINVAKMRRKSSGLKIFNVRAAWQTRVVFTDSCTGSKKPSICAVFPQRLEHIPASSGVSQ